MNKINKESVNNQTSHVKDGSSSDLLCAKFENIKDDLIVGFSVKHNSKEFAFLVRLDKKDQH